MNLIIGGSGLLGSYLKKVITHYDAPNHSELDLESYTSIKTYLDNKFYHTIYIAAAFTNVDGCEREEIKSFNINCKSIQYINELSSAKIVYYSTDYVFDGLNGHYTTRDMPNPINTYGRHKLCSENYLLSNTSDALIIRTSWLFGKDDKQLNFPMQVINKLKNNESITVNPTHFGTPTYAGDLAEKSVALVVTKSGVHHAVSSANLLSKYDFAIQISNMFGLDSNLIIKKDFKPFAKRPLKAGLFRTDANLQDSLDRFKNDF